jgi:hypothetical protein
VLVRGRVIENPRVHSGSVHGERTLLSAAVDLDVDQAMRAAANNPNSGGQECPPSICGAMESLATAEDVAPRNFSGRFTPTGSFDTLYPVATQ